MTTTLFGSCKLTWEVPEFNLSFVTNVSDFTFAFFSGMPLQLWAALLLCLVPSPWVITSGLPSIPNPNGKAAFSQILQANMEIERDCKYLFMELRSL